MKQKTLEEEVMLRRREKHNDSIHRHANMAEKLLLEKERSQLRKNYLANQTFQIGQGLLTDIKGRASEADSRKLNTIQKTRTR